MAGRFGKKSDSSVKVLVMGPAGSGKTQLISRLSWDKFSDKHIATIGALVSRFGLKGTDTKLEIYDTAGEKRYAGSGTAFQKGAHLVFLCFDPTKKGSLEEVKASYESLLKRETDPVSQDCQVVLVATKLDKLASKEIPNSIEEARAFARDKRIPYVETSAKQGTGFEGIKSHLHRVILKIEQSIQERKREEENLAVKRQEADFKNILVTAVEREINRLREGARWYTRGRKAKANRIEKALKDTLQHWGKASIYTCSGFDRVKKEFLTYEPEKGKSLKTALNSYRYFSLFNCALGKPAAACEAVEAARPNSFMYSQKKI